MGGKLDLTGDLSYSIDKSRYGTQATVYSGATCSLPTVLTCGDLPDIQNKVVTLKLTGIYALDQASKISVGYMFQKLTSDDYFYNAFQYGYSSLRLMPTNQQSGSYVGQCHRCKLHLQLQVRCNGMFGQKRGRQFRPLF